MNYVNFLKDSIGIKIKKKQKIQYVNPAYWIFFYLCEQFNLIKFTMENKIDIEQIKSLIKEILNEVSNTFGKDYEFSVTVEQPNFTITMTSDVDCGCGTDCDIDCKCGCKEEKEELKPEEELTLGERFVLKVAKDNELNEEDVNFENILNIMTDSPVVDFLLNDEVASEEYSLTKRCMCDYVNNLIQSLFDVDYSKFRKLN